MSTPDTRTGAGIAFVVASAAAFGAMAIFARFAYASGVDTPTLLALRFSIAAVAMTAIAGARKVSLPRGKTLAGLVALGALGYGGQAFSFFTALTLAPAGVVALLLYLHPAIVALLASLLLHERLNATKVFSLVVALAGTTLTIAPALGADAGAVPSTSLAGIGFAVAAALFYSAYIIVGAWLARRAPPLAMGAVVIASAAVVFAATALARGPQWPQTTAGWIAIGAIALISTVAAITFYFAGLERIGPTRAATLSTVEPLVTVALATVLLGETIAMVQFAGGALILAAVVLLARASRA